MSCVPQVVGAGATAKKSQNYGELWRGSDLARKVEADMDELHQEYSTPVHDDMSGRAYASSWGAQLYHLTKRGFLSCRFFPCLFFRFVSLPCQTGVTQPI